jgi:hypothetical protein
MGGLFGLELYFLPPSFTSHQGRALDLSKMAVSAGFLLYRSISSKMMFIVVSANSNRTHFGDIKGLFHINLELISRKSSGQRILVMSHLLPARVPFSSVLPIHRQLLRRPPTSYSFLLHQGF